MITLFSFIFFACYYVNVLCNTDYIKYVETRNNFLKKEESLTINQAWELTHEEQLLDEKLTSLKSDDNSLDPVPVQFSFGTMQSVINDSNLFQLLQKLPKGALLHSHDVSSLDTKFYVKASYDENCLYNINASSADYGVLTFRTNLGPEYVPISHVRNNYIDGVEAFDQALYYNFTILQELDQIDLTGDSIWENSFQPIFSRLHGLYEYVPVFKLFYEQMFSRLLEDGVTRWEIRTSLSAVYDLDKQYTSSDAMRIIIDVFHEWQNVDLESRKHFSFAIIVQGMRGGTRQEVREALLNAYALRNEFPEYVVGFDLVGHEDPGQTLFYWSELLIEVENMQMQLNSSSAKLPFFFHAAESNRIGVQENIVDAVFLNSSRIGHGFGIQEFPALWPLLVEKSILIESCPISNQLLGLVVDLRNHPIGQMLRHSVHDSILNTVSRDDPLTQSLNKYQEIAEANADVYNILSRMKGTSRLPVSISNDDPGFWGIDASVSYDWYVSVLAWDLSISGIKQLALDSIIFSSASLTDRVEMVLQWQKDWNDWVSNNM